MLQELRDKGYAIARDYFNSSRLDEIRADFQASRSRMKAAGVGKSRALADSIRRDEIVWLDPLYPTQSTLLQELDKLREELNRALFLGLRSFEGHYAHYPAGGFYRRHLDRFRMDDSRTVSLVLYLNSQWQESHGGKLRLYTKDNHIDVAPKDGTLVLFLSGEIEHEVLESFATRMSLTGWFKT